MYIFEKFFMNMYLQLICDTSTTQYSFGSFMFFCFLWFSSYSIWPSLFRITSALKSGFVHSPCVMFSGKLCCFWTNSKPSLNVQAAQYVAIFTIFFPTNWCFGASCQIQALKLSLLFWVLLPRHLSNKLSAVNSS